MTPTDRPPERWDRPDLAGRVALVAGASRGVGRGIAEALGSCGATVRLLARHGLAEVAGAIESAGGRAVPVPCDLADDAAVEAAFERIGEEAGHLDLVVANAVGWVPGTDEERAFMVKPPWHTPMWWWDQNFAVGVRSHFLVAKLAVPLLRRSDRGLLVFTGERPPAAPGEAEAVLDLRATAVERMTSLFAHHLRSRGVTCLLLYPGFTRTEDVVTLFEQGSAYFDGWSAEDFVARTASMHYAGRAVCALVADPAVADRSGRLVTSFEAAEAYGFTDVDGRKPDPL